MNRIKLSSILKGGPNAIIEIGARLARSEVILDGSGVEALSAEQLEFLMADIPVGWDIAELGAVIDDFGEGIELQYTISNMNPSRGHKRILTITSSNDNLPFM